MSIGSAILDSLYHHFTSHPGLPKMTLGALYESIGVSPNDDKGVGEARYQLFSLKRRGWVEYQILENGSGGVVEITSEGIRIAEDRKQSMPPIPELEILEPLEGPRIEAVIPEPCPATLEDVVQADRACAGLFQRHDVLGEIKMLFGQASSTCHFVVLYGEPMVGKTRILVRLSEVLGDEYVPLRVTSQGLGLSALGDLDAFVFDLAVQLQVKFEKWAYRHSVSVSPNVPDRNAFQHGRGVRAFYTHWDKLRQQTGNRRPVVMFDEIERLLDHEDRLNQQILTFLDDFVCNLENGCVIVAGSERILQLRNELFEILISRGRPIRVRYYDKEAASSIFSAIQNYFTFDEDVLHYLTAICDGHPRLLSAAY